MDGQFNFLKLILRNLRYHRRETVQVALALALTTAVISGAFLIGASVNESLTRAKDNRLGKIVSSISQPERWFKQDLPQRLDGCGCFTMASLISVPGYAVNDKGTSVRINVYGVDKNFWKLAPEKTDIPIPAPGSAYFNREATKVLGLGKGSSVAIRCFKPSVMPGDTAWSSNDSGNTGFRLTVEKIVRAGEFGDFNPYNTQMVPVNVFVDRDWLAKRLGRESRANMLVSDAPVDQRIIPSRLELADYGLYLEPGPDGTFDLKSDQVFLPSAVAGNVANLKLPEQRIFTYFANSISANGQSTPYSFVSGVESAKLSGHDTVVTQWLADDLKLKVGDSLGMTYYIFSPMGELQEASAAFRVKAIIPNVDDPDLMPKFPGMTDANSCSDWDPGIPVNLKKIRAKDEAYWEKYRGSPKLLVPLEMAKKLWGCRFGKLTSIRIKSNNKDKLVTDLTHALDPAESGFVWSDIAAIGNHGVENAVDFSGLFFGLSFFVVAAGIILSSLLLKLHLESRSREFSTLRALGYRRMNLFFILTGELCLILVLGVVFGTIAAFGYNYLILLGLNSVWNNIAGSIQVMPSYDPVAIIAGGGISFFLLLIVLLLSIRKTFKVDIAEGVSASVYHKQKVLGKLSFAIFMLLMSIFFSFVYFDPSNIYVHGVFHISLGVLIGMFALCEVIIIKLPDLVKGRGITLITAALRNNSRHLKRSMSVVSTMGLGIFLVLTVSIFRIKNRDVENSVKSGTGGFNWFVETAIPVKGNLNEEAGRKRYNLKLPYDLKIVQFPMVEGGAAGCLNLNRVSRPRLIGVPPGALRDRFKFTNFPVKWEELQNNGGSSKEIMAIADANVIKWSLGLKVGDTMDYPAADGTIYKLKFIGGLENSIFQGMVLISRANLLRMYPDVSGSRILLVEDPNPNIVAELSRGLENLGPDVESCAGRLNRYASIQNTYLGVFLALGGIGLLIGTAGLAIVLMRNLLERRSEIAWLRAAGFSRRRIVVMIMAEHMMLFYCALLIGIVAAGAAGLSIIFSPSGDPPWLQMIILILLIWGFAAVFNLTAAFRTVGLDILKGLRRNNE